MKYFLLILVSGLALFLRIYQLDRVPVSMSWDEVAIGYNAWSIVKTGKDEYGVSWPVLFKSFNDYKLPGYIYSAALSIKLLGFTDFAVRFPSALFGALTVIAFYFLIKEFQERETPSPRSPNPNNSKYLPLLGSLLMAISPWHLQFSRGAYEANGSLLFVVIGFWLLLGARRKPRLFIGAAVSFTMALYFYYTARLLLPLVLLVYALIYRKKLLQQVKWLGISLLVGVICLLPILPKFFAESNTRIGQVSIFSDEASSIDYTIAGARSPQSWWAKLYYNRRVGYLTRFLDNYLTNNSLSFLFVTGDPYPRHRIWGMGYLYLWQLPFFIFGLTVLLKRRSKIDLFVLGWWILGAVPASLTTGSPHGLRTLTTLPVLLYVSVIGLELGSKVVRNKWKKVATGTVLVCAFISFIGYLVYYYDFTPRQVAQNWGDGHRELFAQLPQLAKNYDDVVITGTYFKPYIYALYYLPVEPDEYQLAGNEREIGKYKFLPAAWEKAVVLPSKEPGKKRLLVLTPEEKSQQKVIVATIAGTFGDPRFVAQVD